MPEHSSSYKKILDLQDSKTLKSVTKILYNEMTSGEIASILGGLFVAASDNSVYWMLNKNSANIINDWLNISDDYQNIIQTLLLINGVITITSMDLYASRILIREIFGLIRRINLIPDYYKYVIGVIIFSSIISLFGVSGAAALTYNLHRKNKTDAIIFCSSTVIVNLLNTVFFAVSQFDTIRLSHFKKRLSINHHINTIQNSFNNMARNIKLLPTNDFVNIVDNLKNFNNIKQPTATDINDITTQLKSLLMQANDELDEISLSEENNLQINTIIKFPQIIISIFAFWIYYNVGEIFFISLFNKSPDTSLLVLSSVVGICMGLMALIGVYFSINNISSRIFKFSNHIRDEGLNNSDYLSMARNLLLFIAGTIFGLSTIDLIDSAFDTNHRVYLILLYTFAIIQSTCINTNALVETSFTDIFYKFYDEFLSIFLNRMDIKQKRATENISGLAMQISKGSEKDIQNIYNEFLNYEMISPFPAPQL